MSKQLNATVLKVRGVGMELRLTLSIPAEMSRRCCSNVTVGEGVGLGEPGSCSRGWQVGDGDRYGVEDEIVHGSRWTRYDSWSFWSWRPRSVGYRCW